MNAVGMGMPYGDMSMMGMGGMGGMGMGMVGMGGLGGLGGMGGLHGDAHMQALMAQARQVEEADNLMRRQVPQLIAGLNAKMAEIQQLRALNTGLAKQVQDLSTQKGALQKERDDSVAVADALSAEVGQLRKQAETDAATHMQTQQALKEHKRAAAAREHELLADNAKLKPALKELDKLRSAQQREKDTEGQKMRDLTSLVAAERKKLQLVEQSSAEQVAKLEKSVAESAAEAARAREAARQASARAEEQAQVAARSQQLLRESGAAHQAEQQQLLAQVNALEQRCQNTNAKLDDVKRALGGTVAALQQDNEALQQELGKLKVGSRRQRETEW